MSSPPSPVGSNNGSSYDESSCSSLPPWLDEQLSSGDDQSNSAGSNCSAPESGSDSGSGDESPQSSPPRQRAPPSRPLSVPAGQLTTAMNRKARKLDWPSPSDAAPRLPPPGSQDPPAPTRSLGPGMNSGRNQMAFFGNDNILRTRHRLVIQRPRADTWSPMGHRIVTGTYPDPSNTAIEAGKSLQEVCTEYPLHVWGDCLRMFIAEGWNARRIWGTLPANARNNGAVSRRHNYLQKAMQREVEKMMQEEEKIKKGKNTSSKKRRRVVQDEDSSDGEDCRQVKRRTDNTGGASSTSLQVPTASTAIALSLVPPSLPVFSGLQPLQASRPSRRFGPADSPTPTRGQQYRDGAIAHYNAVVQALVQLRRLQAPSFASLPTRNQIGHAQSELELFHEGLLRGIVTSEIPPVYHHLTTRPNNRFDLLAIFRQLVRLQRTVSHNTVTPDVEDGMAWVRAESRYGDWRGRMERVIAWARQHILDRQSGRVSNHPLPAPVAAILQLPGPQAGSRQGASLSSVVSSMPMTFASTISAQMPIRSVPQVGGLTLSAHAPIQNTPHQPQASTQNDGSDQSDG